MSPEQACSYKTRFLTESECQSVADMLMAAKGGNNLKPYRCPCCDQWHLTSNTVFWQKVATH